MVAIARKDWAVFWSDRRGAALAFLVPIVLASAFGMIFHRQGSSRDAVRLPVLLVVEGQDALSQQVLADARTSGQLEVQEASREDLEAAIAQRRPGVAIILPADLERILKTDPATDNVPQVQVLHHPLSSAEARWAEGAITEIVFKRLAREKYGAWAEASLQQTPVKIERAAVGGMQSFNAHSHSFSGMALQYLLFWGMESGLLFLRERQRGVWARLQASPVPLEVIVLGKAAATAVIAALQVLALFAVGWLVFGVAVAGSVVGFVLLVLAISGLSAATGLLVASVGGNETRARSLCILVILSASMLGGLWLPTFLLPNWVRDLALVLPTSWAMRGLEAVTWQGLSWSEVWPSIGAVSVFSGVFFLLAVRQLQRQERKRRLGWA